MDVLRLINRHGVKIWLGTWLGEVFLVSLSIIGLIAVWFFLNPSLETIQSILSTLYFPDDPEQVIGRLRTGILQAGPGIGMLLVALIAFFGCSVLLSVTGLMGLIRQAAVEDRVSIGHFFVYAFRYFPRMVGLVLIQSVSVLLAGWLFFWLFSLAESGALFRAVLGGAGAFVGIVALAFFSFLPVVMLVEGTGMFRTFGAGFRLLRVWPGKTVSTFLTAGIAALLGGVLLGILAAFPWLILQLFQNVTIAGLVSLFFGLLMALSFHVFPAMFFFGTLFASYVKMRGRLYPARNHREETPPPRVDSPISPDARWTRMQ